MLHEAVKFNRMEAVQLLVDRGAAIDRVGGLGWTPLHIACRDGFQLIAEFLIDLGADVNVSCTHEVRPHSAGRWFLLPCLALEMHSHRRVCLGPHLYTSRPCAVTWKSWTCCWSTECLSTKLTTCAILLLHCSQWCIL